ncbi:MAG: protease modulator HflC [Phycisphaerae bacterium]
MKRAVQLSLLIAIMAWGSTCLLIVDQTQYAIHARFGKPKQVLLEPGLRFKLPWPIDTAIFLDNRLQILENPEPGQPDKEFLTRDEESGIGKNVVVSTYSCWRIIEDQDAVMRFYQTMGDVQSAGVRLGDVVVSEVGASLGQRDFSVLVSTNDQDRDWTGFLQHVKSRCAERVKERYGVDLLDVRIKQLSFPEQNRQNVFSRMRAEREVIASRYRSEGEEQAVTIRADAQRQADQILAEALEKAERIRGEADAEAAKIYAEAYGEDPAFYEFVRTLEAYERTLDEDTVLILSGDSSFLKLLNRQDLESTEYIKPNDDSRTMNP